MPIQKLKKEMRSCIPKYIIERGLDYYEDGHVSELSVHENIVYALVEGNYGDYEVKIDLEDFMFSECECPYESHCKHMAAVVYALEDEMLLISAPDVSALEVLNGLEKTELVSILWQLMNKKREYEDTIKAMLKKMK